MIIELQEKYQDLRIDSDTQRMDIDVEEDTSLKFMATLSSAIELYYDIHTNEPLGQLNIMS